MGDAAYSFDYCYEKLVPFYRQFDVNWINQETLCTDELAPSSYPCFSTPGDCARSLYRAGVRVFSLSNNHTYDKGSAGIAATLRFWASMPEDVVTCGLWRGEEDYGSIPLQTVNGVTIAYLSYTEHTNGIPRSSGMEANVIYTSQTDVISQQVRQAAALADFVVVGVHWGVENSHTITEAQRHLAQSLADWGADVIIGTHPHVLQNAEWRTAADGRQVFVAYSLGNFLSTQNQPDQLLGAILTPPSPTTAPASRRCGPTSTGTTPPSWPPPTGSGPTTAASAVTASAPARKSTSTRRFWIFPEPQKHRQVKLLYAF